MSINIISLQPLGALIAGILILLIARLLNCIVAICPILTGLVGLATPSAAFRNSPPVSHYPFDRAAMRVGPRLGLTVYR